MGLVGVRACIVGLILLPVGLAQSVPDAFAFGGPTGGWSSFRLGLRGDSLLLVLETDSDGPVSFGWDLYDAQTEPLLAVRIMSDDGTPSVGAGVASHTLQATAPPNPFVITGGGGSMSAAPRGLFCSSWTMRLYLDGTRYELELGGCEFPNGTLRGIEYGAGAQVGGRQWSLAVAEGSWFEHVEASPSQFYLSPEDLGGDWVAATDLPVDVLVASSRTLTLSMTGFSGAFRVDASGVGGGVAHRYSSPMTDRDCPCGIIAETGVPGERTFSMDEAQEIGNVRFLLAGVDARLPDSPAS